VPPVLVLGANGFIGRHVVAALSNWSEMEVLGGGLGTPLPGFERRWLDIDLLDVDATRLVSELRAASPSVLVNCTGATTGMTEDLTRLNVRTTARVVEALARSNVPTRLIHLGSSAEYGPGAVGRPVIESAETRPVGSYGIAKLAATQLILAAAGRGREAVVLRVFNALGPSMAPGSLAGAALQRLSEAVAKSTPRIELGPLDSVRDFVDVRDIGAAVVAACRVASLEAPIVNVGSGTGHSARELVEALAQAVGFGGEIAEGAAGSPRSSEVPWQVADVSLAKRLLGWQAVHDLRSSVELMVAGR